MAVDASAIREHMPVVGSDGEPVGTVDRVEGQRIKLTRNDPQAGGQHHFLHLDMVAAVEGGSVRLTRTGAEARDEWGVEAAGSTGEARGAEPGSSRAGP
jgi:hypothetical protein